MFLASISQIFIYVTYNPIVSRPTFNVCGNLKGPSINYVSIFTTFLDPLSHFLHVKRNGNVKET